MSALGALSGGAAGVAGLLSLRRRAAAPPPPSSGGIAHQVVTPLKCAAVPDAGHLVWGRQLRPALALLPTQPAKKPTARPPAAASASAGSLLVPPWLHTTCQPWLLLLTCCELINHVLFATQTQGGQARWFLQQVPLPGHRLLLLHVVRCVSSEFSWQLLIIQQAKLAVLVQVLPQRHIQHPQQEDLQLLPIPIVSRQTLTITLLTVCSLLRSTQSKTSPPCSFVSAIHLAVGVVYCLISWSFGLPKRAVHL